eukprot:7685657-Alexandrium_andersonii.AAC.1
MEAEAVLGRVAADKGVAVSKAKARKGRITFTEQRVHPQAYQAQATDIATRALWKATQRAREVQRSCSCLLYTSPSPRD